MKTSLAALAAVLCTSAGALAQDVSPSTELTYDNILVVGQRGAPIEIEPRGLTISLGAEQFAAINALNTEDLIKYAPNFFVRKRYPGDSNGVPGFRGTHSVQSARTLVMVDGFLVSNLLGNSFNFAPKWGIVGPAEVDQFDVVYGPYSSRYAGNSMGGIVNITTRDPDEAEAFATVQGFAQPYSQFASKDDFFGYSAEAGFGLKQKDGPFSVRVTGRYFRNEGQPMQFYGLNPVTGAPGTVVAGAVVDPKHVLATAAGTGIPRAPGNASNPYFAAQSPANITQAQAKLKVGYDDGAVTGQLLFAYWHNQDKQRRTRCYLRDEAGNNVCDGRVTIDGQTYTAAGANFSEMFRHEYLAGVKIAAPLGDATNVRLALSTYQIPRSDTFTSSGYANGKNRGTGTVAIQGPTGWWTGDLVFENKTESRELALGLTGNFYRTDQSRYAVPNWTSKASKSFEVRTFGKTRQLSAWAEARFLLDPLTVTLGTRYDNWRAADGGLIQYQQAGLLAGQNASYRYGARKDDSISPSLSFEYRLDRHTQIQLSLAMATRYPTVGELFQGSFDGNGAFNANSFDPNLKPERSKDANFLIARDFGWMKLTGSAFYQRVKDTVFAFVGPNAAGFTTSNYKNIDLTRQYGFEIIAETRDWPVEGMYLDANAAWIDSRTVRNAAAPEAEGVQFPRIPKRRINANLRYDLAKAVQASLGLRYASRPNTDLFGKQRGDTFGFTSELFALDARVSWDAADNLRLSAGVDNITNDRAWVFHPYQQRTFLIEAGWKM